MIQIAEHFWCLPQKERYKNPGDAYNNLTEDAKEILKNLKSDDLKDIRIECFTSVDADDERIVAT